MYTLCVAYFSVFVPKRRFTSHLLAMADHVTAVDFMESFVQKNKQNNRHHSNGVFIQADVTKLDFPKNRYNVWGVLL